MTHMFTFFKVCKHIYIYIPLPGELLIHDIHVLAQLLALRPRWMINGRICRRSSKSGAARLEGRPSETGSSAVVASWRQHPAIGYCLVKRLGRWLGRWLGKWLGEVLRSENVMKMTFHWKMIFKGSMWVYRKVIWSHMVMGPIWRQSQASSEWPIDVWEPPSLIHFWRANIHGKCRWDILGYIFCDAAYSKIFQEYSQQCSQFYSGEVIIQRNSTEMNIQLLFQLLLPS